LQQEDDIKVVVEEAKKDPQAFVKIYDLFFEKIYTYAYYKVGNATEAEDITEQVFLKALEAIGRYTWKKGVPFSSWIFKIAHNQVVDYFRAQGKVINKAIDEEQINKLPDEKRSFEEEVDLKLLLEDAQKAISKLNEDQQSVILLKFLSGFSNAEIANFLNKSEGAVKSLQHRVLVSLRELLKERFK